MTKQVSNLNSAVARMKSMMRKGVYPDSIGALIADTTSKVKARQLIAHIEANHTDDSEDGRKLREVAYYIDLFLD